MCLEFLVIGAQKAGTTTLWNLLRDHPQLWLPDAKEAPFFSHTEVYERGWESYLQRLGVPIDEDLRRGPPDVRRGTGTPDLRGGTGTPDLRGGTGTPDLRRGTGTPDLRGGTRTPDLLRGTITPHYMHGWHDASTRRVAERIARRLPEVRLIALLRDPVSRARSQHAMAIARGRERRDVDRAMRELLRPEALREGRLAPNDTNSYIAQGEYGRILGEYLSFFPRAALHVELSDSLSRDPRGVVRRVLRFLGARDDYEPAVPFQRSFVGGRKPRVRDEELVGLLRAIDATRREGGEGERGGESGAVRAWVAERTLDPGGLEEFERIMRRYLDAPPARWYRERVGLEFTLRKIWNVMPSPPEPISAELRAALYAHFAEDAPALAAATGLTVPWGASG